MDSIVQQHQQQYYGYQANDNSINQSINLTTIQFLIGDDDKK